MWKETMAVMMMMMKNRIAVQEEVDLCYLAESE